MYQNIYIYIYILYTHIYMITYVYYAHLAFVRFEHSACRGSLMATYITLLA